MIVDCPPPGYWGSAVRNCFDDGTWSVIQVQCADVICSEGIIDFVDYPSVRAGELSFGECVTGYYGTGNVTCLDVGGSAQWGTPQFSCQEVFCLNTTEGDVGFLETMAGETAIGLCPPGSYGSVTLPCLQNGDSGAWGAQTGSCTECPSGTYQNLYGQAQCQPCITNAESPAGSVSPNDCQCLPGYNFTNNQCQRTFSLSLWPLLPGVTLL